MTEADLSFIKCDIGLDKVAPIDRRQSSVSVNCILMELTQVCNDFAVNSAGMLMAMDEALQTVDTRIKLLEYKLGLVEIDDSTPEEVPKTASPVLRPSIPMHQATDLPQSESTLKPSEVLVTATATIVETTTTTVLTATANSNRLLVKDDPAFSKYFKMLKMGVVAQAVRLKMQSEGVDPSWLDKADEPSPNALEPVTSIPEPLPTPSIEAKTSRRSSESDSISSFSDSD